MYGSVEEPWQWATATDLSVHGNIVVDDEIDGGDVETPRSDVRCDEDISFLGAELVQCAEPLRLCHTAVDAHCGEAELAQKQCEPLAFVLRIAKDNH